jgi:hypothetical protein
LKQLTKASPLNCQANLELGIAEEDTFTFLDKEELNRLETSLKTEGAVSVLDFFCALRYHTTAPNGKTKPLKFDYILLRFAFQRKTLELFLAHERGIQRTPLEDFAIFLINRINNELVERKIRPLTLKHMRTL